MRLYGGFCSDKRRCAILRKLSALFLIFLFFFSSLFMNIPSGVGITETVAFQVALSKSACANTQSSEEMKRIISGSERNTIPFSLFSLRQVETLDEVEEVVAFFFLFERGIVSDIL